MMWFKKLLRDWVFQVEAGKTLTSNWPEAVISPQPRPESPPACQVTLRKAMNGYFLELAQHTPQTRGPDWKYSYFVINDTADLPGAIAALLVSQKLENS